MQFSSLTGNVFLSNRLTRIVDESRVSHTQLFLGKDGYGSLAFALAYAQYLNCTNRIVLASPSEENTEQLRADSCGKCPSCIKYQRLVHPDLHLFFPTTTNQKVKTKNTAEDFLSEFKEFLLQTRGYCDLNQWYDNLGVENKQGQINVRDSSKIVQHMLLKPYEASYKVVVVWHIEKLNHDAAPKLLKSLEEPGKQTLFLLIAPDEDKILPTILSRAQQVRIPPISFEEIERALSNQSRYDQAEIRKAALLANGDLAYANRLLGASDDLTVFAQLFVQWMRATIQCKTQISHLVSFVDQIAKFGREFQKQYLQYSSDILRSCLNITLGIEPKVHPFEREDERFRDAFPHFITQENIHGIYQAIDRAINYIERNANAKIVFMDLSIRLGSFLQKHR